MDLSTIPQQYHQGVPAEDMEFLEHAAAGRLNRVRQELKKAPGKIRSTDYYGFTSLHWAAYGGRVPVVEALLQHRADPNAVTLESNQLSGWTPLHSAAAKNSAGAVQLLLEHGARQVATHLNHGAATRAPADMARSAEVVEILRQHGSRVVQLLPLATDSTVTLCTDMAGEELMRFNMSHTRSIQDIRVALAQHLDTQPGVFKFVDGEGKICEDEVSEGARSTPGKAVCCIPCLGDLSSLLHHPRRL